MKKISYMLIAILFALNSISFTSFATEPIAPANTTIDNVNSTTSKDSFGGYGHRVTGTDRGSFGVSCPSGAGAGAGITIKSECNSDGAFSYISIEKPDGTFFGNNIYLDGNEEKKFQIWFPQNGTYTIHYVTYTPDQTVHLQCWIYG